MDDNEETVNRTSKHTAVLVSEQPRRTITIFGIYKQLGTQPMTKWNGIENKNRLSGG